jgi:hypothetical protein
LQPRHDCSGRHIDHFEPGVVVHADVEIAANDLWVEALVAAKAEPPLAAEIVGDEGEALGRARAPCFVCEESGT